MAKMHTSLVPPVFKPRLLKRMFTKLASLALCSVAISLLSGCAPPASGEQRPTSPILSHAMLGSPVVEIETQTLTPREISQVMDMTPDAAYRLGSNDVISLSIYMHPELSVPAIPALQGGTPGALITGDGTTQMPLIGTVHLGGLTLPQAQAIITANYGRYIKNPQVTINLIQAESLRYYLLGVFATPGVKYPVHELTLLEALALGGSVDINNADLYQAYVAHGAVKLPVDMHALLLDGDLSQNITLQGGDAIVVPSSQVENAYVLGAVGKPGAIQFQAGSLSLLQALSAAGLDLPNYTDARLSQIRIIRSHGRSAEFYVVDAAKILNGQAVPFGLQPGDIVFVPPTLIATWNQVLEQIIPSLQAAADSLSPFVSIKYLQSH